MSGLLNGYGEGFRVHALDGWLTLFIDHKEWELMMLSLPYLFSSMVVVDIYLVNFLTI